MGSNSMSAINGPSRALARQVHRHGHHFVRSRAYAKLAARLAQLPSSSAFQTESLAQRVGLGFISYTAASATLAPAASFAAFGVLSYFFGWSSNFLSASGEKVEELGQLVAEQQKFETTIRPAIGHLENLVKVLDPILQQIRQAHAEYTQTLPAAVQLGEEYRKQQVTIQQAKDALAYVSIFLSKTEGFEKLNLLDAAETFQKIEKQQSKVEDLKTQIGKMREKVKNESIRLAALQKRIKHIARVEKDQYGQLLEDIKSFKFRVKATGVASGPHCNMVCVS